MDRWIAADLGVDHPQVYREFFDDGETVWMRKKYSWDSNREMRQKTDAQYVEDLITFMGPNNACQVIIPPEGASFRAECVLRGLWVTNAFNEVMEGLQAVMGMMAKRKFRIHRSCEETIKGIETRVWDPNKAKRGIEEPMKQDDDAADMVRYGIASKCPKWRNAG